MKHKIFVVFMIIFTVYIAVILLISLICGAPLSNRAELNRYLFGAVGMAILLPVGFSFFFSYTLHLSKKLDEIEEAAEKSKCKDIYDSMDINAQIRDFVNTLSEKKNLPQEKSEDLISYIEDL